MIRTAKWGFFKHWAKNNHKKGTIHPITNWFFRNILTQDRLLTIWEIRERPYTQFYRRLLSEKYLDSKKMEHRAVPAILVPCTKTSLRLTRGQNITSNSSIVTYTIIRWCLTLQIKIQVYLFNNNISIIILTKMVENKN